MRNLCQFLQRHRLFALVIVNLALLFLVVLVLEVGLRIAPPQWLKSRISILNAGKNPETVGTDRDWKIVTANGKFLKFAPNSRFDMINDEYQNVVDVDELGGRRHALIGGSTNLIPCLGDSFTFGVGVGNDETFVSHLQTAMPGRWLNLGVPGSALPMHRFILEQRFEELGRPPVCLFFFFLGNDFGDIEGFHRKQQSREPEVAADTSSLFWRLNAVLNDSFLKRSYAAQFLKRNTLGLVNRLRRPDQWHGDTIFRVLNRQETAYHEHLSALLNVELKEMVRLQSRLGCRFLMILIPGREQILMEHRHDMARYYGLDPAFLDPGLPNKLLITSLDEAGLPWIDVTPEFAQRPVGESLYYVHDNHFTASGHKFFAEKVRPALKAWLQSP